MGTVLCFIVIASTWSEINQDKENFLESEEREREPDKEVQYI